MRELLDLLEHEHAPRESEAEEAENDGGAEDGRDRVAEGGDMAAGAHDDYTSGLTATERAALMHARNIATHGPLLTQVPYSQRHTFQECAAIPLAALLRAREADDLDAYVAALVQLLRLP